MTQTSSRTLTFKPIGKGRSLKDAFVIAFLAIVLGAFVAQISSSPTPAPAASPYASAVSTTPSRG